MESVKEKVNEQEMMKVYKDLGTPSDPHKRMAKNAGKWDIVIKGWMDPDKPPTESKGVSEQAMILGGRYLQENINAEMMGASYSGIAINGFDNSSKQFQTSWVDNMGTGIFYAAGTASADGMTITQNSLPMHDPFMGEMTYRVITRYKNDDSYSFEMLGVDKSGNENKMMEISYTRQK